MRALLFNILLLVLLSFLGCSGNSSSNSGNGNTGTAPSLSGEYFLVQIMDDEVNSGGYIITGTFLSNFDGAGSASFQTDSHSLNDTTSGNYTYTIQPDGRLSTSDNFSGMVSSDSSMFAFVDTDTTDNAVQVFIGIKTSSGMSTSDLDGDFIIVAMGDDKVDTGGHARAIIGSATFDGNGNCDLETLSSSDGIIGNTQSDTYTVQSDGRLAFPGSDLTGFVSADGKTIIWADTDVSDDDVGIGIGMKTSSGMSGTDAIGEYLGAYMIDREVSNENRKTALISYTYDGSGQIAYRELSASDGQPGSGTHSLHISTDGCMNNSYGIIGLLSSDGDMFIHGNAKPGEDVLGIEIGIRKSG